MGTSANSLSTRFNNMNLTVTNIKNGTDSLIDNLGTIAGSSVAETLSDANTNISNIKDSTDLIGAKDDATENTIFGKLNSISSNVGEIKTTTNNTKTTVDLLAGKLYQDTDNVFDKVNTIQTKVAGIETLLGTMDVKLDTIKTIVEGIDPRTMPNGYKARLITEVDSYCSNTSSCVTAIIGVLERDGYLKQ